MAAATEFAAVAALRLAAYRAAPEFTMADEAAVVRWDGLVLVADCAGVGLVATMQVIECAKLLELQQASDSLPPPDFPAFPTLLLNRGATLPGRNYMGLNSRLRLAALEMAMADTRLQSLTGFVYEGAPRLNLLRELGYAFTPVEKTAHQHVTGHTSEFFVALRRPQFAAAREKLLRVFCP
ncbi:hypothetical protein [Hymenobacter cheonanensis]|uniref:hypothetical protein n=1 Tax=Hymenobacter sp. CA2-7 TaxID=3063993 RepID=UPI002714221F|nr:hypothetical protein [Hymenobacter sp. CA2-7]MDO7886655.1 hypothetical protein [Hymenobacter sp. CA2-7]